MKRNMKYKTARLVLLCGLSALCLSGCGKKISLKIQDGYTETQIEAPQDKTVGEILNLAEIKVGNQDQITPSLETQIHDSGAEVVILRHADVTVDTGRKSYQVSMTGKKVEDALRQAKVIMDDNDTLNHQKDAFLQNGMSIQVTKRYAVSATINGDTQKYLTDAQTVGDFLEDQGITVGKHDMITTELTAKLKEGIRITVQKTDIKKEVRTEEIPFTTTVKYSSSMEEGTSKVTRAGVPGKKEVTYRVTYVDGKKEKETVLSEKVIRKQVAEVITRGTKKKVETRNGKAVVSKQAVYDCDGSGHGYYIITYKDGSVEYEDF